MVGVGEEGLRPQCTTHTVFRAWQEAEASWAGRTCRGEAPRPETCGFIPRVGPEGSSPCCCHMKRCVSIVRGHAGASGGAWHVHPRAERERVATQRRCRRSLCVSDRSRAVVLYTVTGVEQLGGLTGAFGFSLALTKGLKTAAAAWTLISILPSNSKTYTVLVTSSCW